MKEKEEDEKDEKEGGGYVEGGKGMLNQLLHIK